MLILATQKASEITERLTPPLVAIQERAADIRKLVHFNSELIENVLHGFSEYSKAYRANDILIDNQFVFTDGLFDSKAEEIINSASPEEWITNYYFSNNELHFQELMCRCKESLLSETEINLFNECMQAYQLKNYHLACIGLFALADWQLTVYSENQTTSVVQRLNNIYENLIAEKPISEYDARFYFIFDSMCFWGEDKNGQVLKCRPLYQNSDFKKQETPFLNRHWTMHGRTKRDFSRLDVLRILQWMDGLMYLTDNKY